MGGRLGRWIESIVYAGLERPSDPLYLSNRTPRQRTVLVLLLAVPFLIVGGVLLAAWWRGVPDGPERVPPEKSTPAARGTASNTASERKAPEGVEVVEAHVDRTGRPKLIATIRNRGTRPVSRVVVAFALLDRNGSRIGAIQALVDDLTPGSSRNLAIPIIQSDAVSVMVSEIQAPWRPVP
jgi:hypothetical protein